jgi:hypothetical protein
MALPAEAQPAPTGTRFQIYPQPKWPRATIFIDAPPGTIGPGPKDDYIEVIDAVGKDPYKDEETAKPRSRPPYPEDGKRQPPVKARGGHFDHLRPGTRDFSSATVFATIRFVLDAWKQHFGRPLAWFFRGAPRPLEVIPRVYSSNAWSGEGYLEFGFPAISSFDHDFRHPLAENFDAVAHETGHFMLKSILGAPIDDRKTLEYRAYEEASADLVAIVASLHVEPVLRCLLERTRGRLYSVNELSRIAELGNGKEFRRAFNDKTMADESVKRAENRYDKYGISLPFTGAAFDLLVELYERQLVERGAITPALARRSARFPRQPVRELTRAFSVCYERAGDQFTAALEDARDEFGRLLARAWDVTSVDGFSYPKAVAILIATDAELNEGACTGLIRKLFGARGISVARG